MKNQTHPQGTTFFPAKTSFPARSLTSWLESASTWIAHLEPSQRGLGMLLALLLVAIPVVAALFPSKVIPASAAPEVFSGERAMAHLPVIASQPHPQGSPAQARVRDYLVQELVAAGVEVEVQRTRGLENVVARLHGSNSTGAIVVLTHYDSVAGSPGAGDNGSTVAALLEIMRALAAGPVPHNDVIALFHDGEEYPDIFAGTKAFIREHPWMEDVRLAISIDSAVGSFISMNEVGPHDNGWLVQALAQAYTGGGWMSFSGGGEYNSEPFIQAGIPVLTLEDGYPFWQKHTAEDTFEIIRPGSVQQMGEQVVSIVHVLGNLDLVNPWGEQQTYFSVPGLAFIHYPQDWALPLASLTGLLLLATTGLALWKRLISWRGMSVALGAFAVLAVMAVAGIRKLSPRLPALFHWKTYQWEEWPEVIPPNGGLVCLGLALLVLGLVVVGYVLARRWSTRMDFSLVGLAPFAILAVVLAANEPRTAYAPTWPVLMGALTWGVAILANREQSQWVWDIAAMLVALPVVVILLPFLPGIVMADGMKSLFILAGIEVALLVIILPAVDSLLVRKTGEPSHA